MKHLLVFALAVCLVISAAHTQTWVSLNGPQIASSVRDISVTNSGVTVYSADNSYVLKSSNSGSGWFVTGQAYSSPLLVLVKPDDSTKVLAAKNGELAYNNNGGSGTWTTPILNPNLTPLRLVAAVNNTNRMLLGRTRPTTGSPSPIWRSPDGGQTWLEVTTFTAHTNITDFAPYPNNNQGWPEGLVLAGGSANGAPGGSSPSSPAVTNGLWLSTDYGFSWQDLRFGGGNVRSLAIVPEPFSTGHYTRVVVENVSSGNDVVWRNIYINNDETWTTIPLSPAPADIYLIRRKNSNGYLFLATSNGVWRSTNKGESFQRIGLTDMDILTIAASATGNTVLAGTASTLYRSTDNGSTWENVGDMDVSSVTAAPVGSTQYTWAVTRDNNVAARQQRNIVGAAQHRR